MSEELHSFDDGPVGQPRLQPTVAFGLRAAALAGLMISVGVSEAATSGLFDNADAMGTWPNGTTCCTEN